VGHPENVPGVHGAGGAGREEEEEPGERSLEERWEAAHLE